MMLENYQTAVWFFSMYKLQPDFWALKNCCRRQVMLREDSIWKSELFDCKANHNLWLGIKWETWKSNSSTLKCRYFHSSYNVTHFPLSNKPFSLLISLILMSRIHTKVFTNAQKPSSSFSNAKKIISNFVMSFKITTVSLNVRVDFF